MIKSEELNDPNSCLNRAEDDEMLFVLRAKDPAAPNVIRFWVQHRYQLGLNCPEDKKVAEALECAAEMSRYQRELLIEQLSKTSDRDEIKDLLCGACPEFRAACGIV